MEISVIAIPQNIGKNHRSHLLVQSIAAVLTIPI